MVAGDRKMKATGLLTNEWSNVRAIACHYDALGRSAFMTTLGKLGDRPCDCAGNLHNIRLLFENNATFQDGHFGDRPQISPKGWLCGAKRLGGALAKPFC